MSNQNTNEPPHPSGKYDSVENPNQFYRELMERLKRAGMAQVRPSPADPNDLPAIKTPGETSVPKEFELEERDRKNQMHGSCTCYGFGGIIERGMGEAGIIDVSEQEMYARLREEIGEICNDSGSVPSDCAKISCSEGWLNEEQAPYLSYVDLCKGSVPNRAEIASARGGQHFVCFDLPMIDEALVLYGVGVTVAFTLFETFFQIGPDGVMPAPAGEVIGGHMMRLEGYRISNSRKQYKICNSWGEEFGDRGYVWADEAIMNLHPNSGGRWPNDCRIVLV